MAEFILLPNMSNQKLISYLNEIADLIFIEKNRMFHLKTDFATKVTISNGMPAI